nr:hypothetical protein BaRGS_032229 [Batillaria attramentaria]
MITLVSLIVMTKCCLLNLCVLCGEKKLAVRGQLVAEQDIDGSPTSNQHDWKAEQRADPELLEMINHLLNPTSKVTSKAGLSLLRDQGRNFESNIIKLNNYGKLDDKWPEEVYLVISQPSEEVPVYQLAPEGGGVGPEPFIVTSSCLSLLESQRSYTLSLLQRPNPSSTVPPDVRHIVNGCDGLPASLQPV